MDSKRYCLFQSAYIRRQSDRPRQGGTGKPAGNYWIGGYENRHRPWDPAGQVQGDGPQGTLTSLPFTIAKPFISFLMGGGCDINTERAELLIGGRVVRTATGKCTDFFFILLMFIINFHWQYIGFERSGITCCKFKINRFTGFKYY